VLMSSASITQKTTKKTSNFSSTEHALYFVEDIMQREMVPFVLLGEVAESVVNDLDREVSAPIEIGVQKTHYTEYARSTFRMFLPPDTEYTDKKISFIHMDTPVVIKIIHRKYKVFESPDQVFYRLTHFKIPNPFASYLKIKSIVQ